MQFSDPQKPLSLHSFAAALQTTDPLFPIGSYAHSYGLEELAASGEVNDADTLLHFLNTTVSKNLSEFELPYLRFLYYSSINENYEAVCELDEEIGASKLSKELRTASASQGQQRLRLLHKIRPSTRTKTLVELKASKKLAPHHLTVFAADYLDLNAPIESALTAWAYQALAAPCTASLKLVRIGQEGAQLVLTKSLQSIQEIVESSFSVEREFAGAFLPALDIASQRHERAYARLFIS